MPRVNVYLPEALHRRAKKARLNLSEVCQAAIEVELQRRARLRALERFVEQLEDRFGPATAEEVADAERWVDGVMAAATRSRPTPTGPRARRRRRSA
jgi:post-segregation antitoxin (ccd killing protein)